MKKSVLWQAAGFAFATLFGTVLHFLYDWTDGSAWVAPFSGVNESTWEHMKLLYWPLLLFALIQRPFFSGHRNFWVAKLAGTLVGLVLIPVLFYTYNGAFGHSPDWLNIAIFYICALAAFALEWWLLRQDGPKSGALPALAALLLLGVLFFRFTFLPPQLPLFQDPTTAQFGIQKGGSHP